MPCTSTNWLSSRPLINCSKETGFGRREFSLPKDLDARGHHDRRKCAFPRHPLDLHQLARRQPAVPLRSTAGKK